MLAGEAAARLGTSITVLDGTAELLPAGDGEFDSAVTSLVLCSVSDQGRKVMLDYRRSESRVVSQYFIFLSPEQVPTLSWTQVPLFGKLAGRLMNPEVIRKEGLLALPPAASPLPKANP